MKRAMDPKTHRPLQPLGKRPYLPATRRLASRQVDGSRHNAHIADYGSSVLPCGKDTSIEGGPRPWGRCAAKQASLARACVSTPKPGHEWNRNRVDGAVVERRIDGRQGPRRRSSCLRHRPQTPPRSGLIAQLIRPQWCPEREGERTMFNRDPVRSLSWALQCALRHDLLGVDEAAADDGSRCNACRRPREDECDVVLFGQVWSGEALGHAQPKPRSTSSRTPPSSSVRRRTPASTSRRSCSTTSSTRTVGSSSTWPRTAWRRRPRPAPTKAATTRSPRPWTSRWRDARKAARAGAGRRAAARIAGRKLPAPLCLAIRDTAAHVHTSVLRTGCQRRAAALTATG